MRLIDADALFAEFENIGWYNNADRDEVAERLVLQAPTIDAVSVVRCEECKYMYDGIKGDGYLICHKFNHFIKADDFCSYGERSDNGKDIQSTDE